MHFTIEEVYELLGNLDITKSKASGVQINAEIGKTLRKVKMPFLQNCR